jgi:hypothetical protein
MRFSKTLVATCLTFSVATGGAVIAAQGDPNGNPNAPSNPNIFSAVQALRLDMTTAFTQLFQTLQNIQTALQGLAPTASNVRVTPPILYGPGGGGLFCAATNISSQPRTIRVEAINLSTATTIPVNGVVEGIVQPNNLINIGNTAGPVAYVCKFTVLDGTRNDIRASATQTAVVGGNNQLTAIVPAE